MIGNAPPAGATTGGGTGKSYESGSPGPVSVANTTTANTTTYPNIQSVPVTGTSPTQSPASYDVPLTATGSTLPSQIQTFKTTMDPASTATAPPTSPITLYQGVFDWGVAFPTTPPSTSQNPSTTTLPVNYATKLPLLPGGSGATGGTGTAASTASTGQYYWVCLRRPANLFLPVSHTNPMVVVDSMRFPMLDATSASGGTGGVTSQDGLVKVPAVANTLPTTGNIAYSAQRYQPYRGGHAVPVAWPITATVPPDPSTATIPVDPRYGYTEQIVVPTVNTLLSNTVTGAAAGAPAGTLGIYYYDTSTSATPIVYYATQQVYHTLGWANEFEQGSNNTLAEDWDYFPFNDRDFTSVAELLLVPGCSPGLFTKQFVEFAPSTATAAIFNSVIPNSSQRPTGRGHRRAGRSGRPFRQRPRG